MRTSANEILTLYRTDADNGLNINEALSRLRIHGPNKLEVEDKVFLSVIQSSIFSPHTIL